MQWWRYIRARQVKWPGWKIHNPGSHLAYCIALVIEWTENKNFTTSDRWPLLFWQWNNLSGVGSLCLLRATTKKRSSTFLRKKVYPGDLARGWSDLEMTWLLCCAGAATQLLLLLSRNYIQSRTTNKKSTSYKSSRPRLTDKSHSLPAV